MREKAPGYVAARANALIAEILEVDYDCLTIVDQSEVGWEKFRGYLDSVLSRDHDPVVPEAVIEIPESARGIAVQAITNIRHSGGIVPIINPSSMTMAQGWPNYYLWKYLGLTPIAIGSNEFRRDMDAVDENTLRGGYFWLQDHGLNFAFEDGGLCESEIFEALRMYYAKLSYYTRGAIAMGTQGQMDMTMVWPATDLSESLMMSTFSPGKDVPVVDVTESDCEALWTSILMQEIIRVKYGEEAPIGFHDVRHYNAEQDTLVLLNSGALALDFMTDSPGDYSDIWAVSQNRSVYFHHGGACIKGIMRADHDALMFRAHGKGNSYHMQGVRMNVLPLSWEERAQHYGELDPWPMGIVQTAGGTTREVTLNWIPNHSQHCAGEYQIMAEMFAACDELGVSRHCYGI
jgi:L-fucose isomerase-like protein